MGEKNGKKPSKVTKTVAKKDKKPKWSQAENAEITAGVLVQILQTFHFSDLMGQLYPIIREIELTTADYHAIVARLTEAGFSRDLNSVRNHFSQLKSKYKEDSDFKEEPARKKGQAKYKSSNKLNNEIEDEQDEKDEVEDAEPGSVDNINKDINGQDEDGPGGSAGGLGQAIETGA